MKKNTKKKKTSKKFYLSIIFMFFLTVFRGQEKHNPKIDKLFFDNYQHTHKTGEFEKGIIINKKIIQKSQQLNYQRGVGKGYLDIASFLSSLTRYEESLKSLEIAEKKNR